jgi:hypothetical protein
VGCATFILVRLLGEVGRWRVRSCRCAVTSGVVVLGRQSWACVDIRIHRLVLAPADHQTSSAQFVAASVVFTVVLQRQ